MSSIGDLMACAPAHLDHYTDPAGSRAFATYDRVGNPNALEPTDLLAPALLDAPIRGGLVIAMYQPKGPYRDLLQALEAVVSDPRTESAHFVDEDLESNDGPWGLVRAALRASDHARGFAASKVTKILHRKRPDLVPIFDSKVAGFYGVTNRKPWDLWPVLQTELGDHRDWLTSLAYSYSTPDKRPLPMLRALDIVVWEHVVQGCGHKT